MSVLPETPGVAIIYDGVSSIIHDAFPSGENLWLTPVALQQATGFQLKPEGACLGDNCVHLPQAERPTFFRTVSGRTYFNLSALSHRLEQPTVQDLTHGIWAFGTGPSSHAKVLTTLEAPNITLPDWKGQTRSLAEFRGRKVLLLTWASW